VAGRRPQHSHSSRTGELTQPCQRPFVKALPGAGSGLELQNEAFQRAVKPALG